MRGVHDASFQVPAPTSVRQKEESSNRLDVALSAGRGRSLGTLSMNSVCGVPGARNVQGLSPGIGPGVR